MIIRKIGDEPLNISKINKSDLYPNGYQITFYDWLNRNIETSNNEVSND